MGKQETRMALQEAQDKLKAKMSALSPRIAARLFQMIHKNKTNVFFYSNAKIIKCCISVLFPVCLYLCDSDEFQKKH